MAKLGLSGDDDVFSVEGLAGAPIALIRKALNDSDRLFLSHLVRYSVIDRVAPRIESRIMFSAYDEENAGDSLFEQGRVVLKELRDDMARLMDEQRTTHILVVTMGWNTPQPEAIGDTNSIFGHLMEEAEKHPAAARFKPLVIGITWPSQSSLSQANYLSKAYDADELGLVWVNHFLNDVVLPLRSSRDIKVVLVGHSLGARALTMGVFASQLGKQQRGVIGPVDLMIGYQAAFSINRFVDGGGIEGAPFASFKELPARFVYTWSKFDAATQLSALYLTPHIGGSKSVDIAKENPDVFDSVTLNDGRLGDVDDGGTKKILHVDTSQLMRYKTFDSSGGAHGDIFRPDTGAFLWSVIERFALGPDATAGL